MGKKPRKADPQVSRRWFDRAIGAGGALAAVWAGQALTGHGFGGLVADDEGRPIGLAWLPDEIDAHRRPIHRAAAAHDVDPRLVAIIVLVESRGHPAARSPVGARGLMQIMPRTAREIARRRGLRLRSLDQLYDPTTNLDYGTWYLAQLMAQFHRLGSNRTVELAAGAYNGGPRRMRRHLEQGTRLPGETREYMRVVVGLWRERDSGISPTLAALWPEKGYTGQTPVG